MNTDQSSTGQALQPAMILEVMGQLEDCLEREAASLIQPEVPDLVDIAAEKTRCFSALVPLDRALRAIAARAEAADGGRLLQHWLDAHGVTGEVAERLRTALASCQRLNQRNGALLLARQRQVALQLQVLGILPENTLYTEKGTVSSGRRGMTSLRI
ncbi:flagellar protein FlgN [Candidatus Macondimonas diazotrophica]|nr:flagellar protein FlgN [Candidatus Macondimonas diazotrophica]